MTFLTSLGRLERGKPPSGESRRWWSFGAITPRGWNSGAAPSFVTIDCVVDGDDPVLRGRLRFVQVEARRIEKRGENGYRPTSMLEIDGTTHLPWEEGELHQVDFETALPVVPGGDGVEFSFPGMDKEERLCDRGGKPIGRVIRSRWPLRGAIRFDGKRARADGRRVSRLSFRVENLSNPPRPDASRAEVRVSAFVSTRLVLEVARGAVLSFSDPPDHAHDVVRLCEQGGAPGLVNGGDYAPGRRVRLRSGVPLIGAKASPLIGCSATIEHLERDVQGRPVLAVTLDDDPARLDDWHARYRYYYADEVDPLPEHQS